MNRTLPQLSKLMWHCVALEENSIVLSDHRTVLFSVIEPIKQEVDIYDSTSDRPTAIGVDIAC